MQETLVRPVRPADWPAVAELFGPNGAMEGCWCMFWLVSGSELKKIAGDGARERFRARIEAGAEPGVLAFRAGAPVGWCAVEPRDNLARIRRSPVLKPDREETGVWSVSCFYVPRAERGRGVTAALLDGAVRHARQRGATAIEGYPRDTDRRLSRGELYLGWPALFERAGFREVRRPAPSRPIMRLT